MRKWRQLCWLLDFQLFHKNEKKQDFKKRGNTKAHCVHHHCKVIHIIYNTEQKWQRSWTNYALLIGVQSSRKHIKEHSCLWLLWHLFEIRRCQAGLSLLYFSQGNIYILLIYLQFLLKNFPFLSCLKNSLEMLQELDECHGLSTPRIRAFQMQLRWSMHIKQNLHPEQTRRWSLMTMKVADAELNILGLPYKARNILALFKLPSSSPLPLARPELLSAGYHLGSALSWSFRAAKWHQ